MTDYVDIPVGDDPRSLRRVATDSPEALIYQEASSGRRIVAQHPGFSSSLLTQEGPGTELKRLLESLGVGSVENCSCRARMEEMNRIGVAQCRERRDEIAGWLRDGQSQFGWAAKLGAAARSVSSGLAFKLDWTDPFQGLVDEAIRRAEDGSPSPTAR